MTTPRRKPPSRRSTAQPAFAPASAQPISDSLAKVLALECWRIGKLIPAFAENRKSLVLQTSLDKMVDALANAGVAIDDPEGSVFRDGMTLNVALFDSSTELEEGQRVISETLSPNIFIREKLAHPARVIVSVGRKEALHGA